MFLEKIMNILFVTAHPDDESLWIGGLLNSFNKINNVNINLICITGKNDIVRNEEFINAMKAINLNKYSILEHEIPQRGGITLNNLNDYFLKGLQELNLKDTEIDLLITHSPYGDEHQHVQHTQLFFELYNYSNNKNIPFGFFSFMATPYYKMTSKLINGKRGHGLHLINLFECESKSQFNLNFNTPKYFIQFKVDEQKKNEMLNCYQSINIAQHKDGYFAWDSFVEGIYIFDDKGFEPIKTICDFLESPLGNRTCFW